MAKYYYNGVLLPGIPADVQKSYPYCWITKDETNSRYCLNCAKNKYHYVEGTASGNGIQFNTSNVTSETARYLAPFDNLESWEYRDTKTTWFVLSDNSLLWTNVDMPNGSATASAIYFEGSDPIPYTEPSTATKYYYNDILLPAIPAEALTEYPYAWILKDTTNGYYNLVLTPGQPYYMPHITSMFHVGFNDGITVSKNYRIEIATAETATNWDFEQDFTGRYEIDDTRTVLWSNANIKANGEDSVNIYFAGSSAIPAETEEPEEPEAEYAERYSILGSILVGTARQIMRLTDSTKKVKPEEFEAKLEGINIQLQELTVTATEEEQVITPSTGFYGFSKVIVEAVESSGGAGSGGEGDDAGDTSDTLLIESSKIFGYEWNYATSLYNGVLLPNPINWPYLLVYNTSTTYYINGANAPFVLDNGSLKTSDGSRCAVGTVDRNTALDANALSSVSWNMTFHESGYATKGKTLVVANHEVINKSNGSTYISPTGEIVASGEGVFAAIRSNVRYIVKKTTLDRLAFHIQKKMGTSAKLSVVDIDAYLDGL